MHIFTPLQVIFFVASIVFLFFAFDAWKRKRLNALHFLVFFGGSTLVALFAWDVRLLNTFGNYFGLQRGADLLVYTTIIVLTYMFFSLLNKATKDDYYLTSLVTQLAIQQGQTDYLAYYDTQNHTNTTQTHTDPKSDFLFFVRGYNEAKVIGETIDTIILAGYSKILFVDDGSKDATVQIVESKRTQYPKSTIIIIRHAINRGRGGAGAATKTGIEYIKKHGNELAINYVVGFDADGQMDITDMEVFNKAIVHHPDCDVYLGSRFVTGSKRTNMPRHRRVILWGAKFVTYFFNGIYVSDPHIGYRVFKLHAIQQIKLYSDNFTYANEMNDNFQTLKFKFIEVPVHIRYNSYTLGKGQRSSNAFRILADLIYRKLFFR